MTNRSYQLGFFWGGGEMGISQFIQKVKKKMKIGIQMANRNH